MRSPFVLAAAVAIGAVTLSSAPDAHALGPIDLEIAAKGGYGTNPFGGSVNPLGAGLGGRAGVGFFGFYGGIAGLYYLGGSQDGVSVHTAMYGFEAGYNWKIAILTIRPQVGIGNFTYSVSGAPSANGNTSDLYVEPGVTGLVSLGVLFVGADANILILPNISQPSGDKGTETAFTLHGQIGVRF
jgi:hypothetical protein